MEESNTPVEPMSEVLKLMREMNERMSRLEAENKELKSARDAEKELAQALPAQSNPYSYGHPRTAMSVVLPTRPVMDDPDNPAWVGKVAGAKGTRKE